jgi:hypothetical protein
VAGEGDSGQQNRVYLEVRIAFDGYDFTFLKPIM